MAKIIVYRAKNILLKYSKYGLYLDGEKIGKIGNAETMEFHLQPGYHIITSRFNSLTFFFSRPVEFNIGEHETKTFNLLVPKKMQIINGILVAYVFISINLITSHTLKLPVLPFIIPLIIFFFILSGVDHLVIVEVPTSKNFTL